MRQKSCRNLECHVSPEEDPGRAARLRSVHVERTTHRGNGHGDIRPVDVRDGVHNEADRNDVQPTLGWHVLERQLDRKVPEFDETSTTLVQMKEGSIHRRGKHSLQPRIRDPRMREME